MSRRVCFALDLVNDAALIRTYEEMHAPGAVWPAVIAHIRAQGVLEMEIWRTGDRLFMVAEVAEDYPRAVPDVGDSQSHEWERRMWEFQRALPHATAHEKWVPMHKIFDLGTQETGPRK